MRINFNKEKLSKFVDITKKISELCSDIQIKDNKVLQKSDSKLYIIETDFSPLLDEEEIINLNLLNSNSRIQLLSIFQRDDADCYFDIAEDYYKISDEESSLKLRGVPEDYLHNKFEDINPLDGCELCFKKDFDSLMIKKIKKVTSKIGMSNVSIEVDKELKSGRIFISSPDNSLVFDLCNLNDIDVESNIYTQINWDCLIINGDSLSISMYTSNEINSILRFKVDVKIGDCILTFYQQSNNVSR